MDYFYFTCMIYGALGTCLCIAFVGGLYRVLMFSRGFVSEFRFVLRRANIGAWNENAKKGSSS